MNIIVFGATGQTGQLVVKRLLEDNHSVTAFVRNLEKLKTVDDNLKVIKGSVLNSEEVSEAMKNQEAVVSCLGGNDNDKTTAITDMTKIIVDSMKKNHMKRIVAISSAGIHNEFSFITNLIVKMFYKHVINDHKLAAQIIMSNDLDYTLARPLSLTEGELTKHYRKTPIGVPKGGKDISRQDLAHFLVDVIENDDHKNETVGLAY